MIVNRLALLLVASLASTAAANAQGGSEFYSQKQIRLIVGFPPGGDYDVGGRLLAKYLGRHIPGRPTVIVQNMPGASSVAAATFIFNRAPHDGTVLGSFSRNVPTQTILGQSGIQFDLRRFIWIGGTSQPSVRVCAKWHSSRVQSADDLFQQELIVPGGGPSSAPSIIPTVLNNVIGTKFRLVEGYRGTSLAMMAMERGEVEGVCQSLSQFRMVASHVQSGKVRFLLHVDENPVPELPDVASAFRYAKTEEQKQMLRFVFTSERFVRSYVLPPNVPPDRAETLRRAIAETAKDPDLLAEAKKMDVDMTYQPPEGFVALLQQLYGASPELVQRVKKLVPNSG